MPLNISDLKPGDRVVLNCPKSRIATHRQAVFEGVFTSLEEAVREDANHGLIGYLAGSATVEFLNSHPWARFLMQRKGDTHLLGAFAVQDDGTLKDEEGRTIFIERRVFVGVG